MYAQAIDRKSRPLPWFTYPAIHFLNRRITPELRLFEYGSGCSTLWFAERVKEVVSVEHDSAWFGKMQRSGLPANVTLTHRPMDGGYEQEIARHGAFDIVVIDGRNRVACFETSLDHLSPRAVVVWDNSNRLEFRNLSDRFSELAFKELPFYGTGPVNPYNWQTSILYRTENCLGI